MERGMNTKYVIFLILETWNHLLGESTGRLDLQRVLKSKCRRAEAWQRPKSSSANFTPQIPSSPRGARRAISLTDVLATGNW